MFLRISRFLVQVHEEAIEGRYAHLEGNRLGKLSLTTFTVKSCYII